MVGACSTNGREANCIVRVWKTKSILSGTKVGLQLRCIIPIVLG